MIKLIKNPKVLKVLATVATVGVQLAANIITKRQQEQEIQRVVEKVLKTTPKGDI